MNSILVSVIIPSYNCGPYIRQAVESVLKQSISLELLIVDDASTDQTFSHIKEYLSDKRVRYLRNAKNMGVSKSRNRGIRAAKGEYIAFLDADDWWDKRKLEKQISCIREKQCVLCYTGRELYKETGESTYRIIAAPEKLNYQKLLWTNSISCSSVLVRADAMKQIPMEHDEIHEDYLVWLRILKKYGTAYGVNEPLLKSRLTKNGKSRNKWRTLPMTYGVYRCLGIHKMKSVFYTGRHVVCSGIRYLC